MYELGNNKKAEFTLQGQKTRVQMGNLATQGSVYVQKATWTKHQNERKLVYRITASNRKVLKNPQTVAMSFRFLLHSSSVSLAVFLPHVILLFSHTLAYTPSPLLLFPTAFTLPSFSSSLHHFSDRVLGPSLGCRWLGLLAGK